MNLIVNRREVDMVRRDNRVGNIYSSATSSYFATSASIIDNTVTTLASKSTIGSVQIGDNINVDVNGVISVAPDTNSTYEFGTRYTSSTNKLILLSWNNGVVGVTNEVILATSGSTKITTTGSTITFSSTDTKYHLSLPPSTNTLRLSSLVGSVAGENDDIVFEGTNGVTISTSGNILRFSSSPDNNNTTIGYQINGTYYLRGNYSKQETLVGAETGNAITTGIGNTGCGHRVLFNCHAANNNTGVGTYALFSNLGDTANNNTAVGYYALMHNQHGSDNVNIGANAGGTQAQSFQDYTGNILIGSGAVPKWSSSDTRNEIVIGYNTNGMGSNTIQIGNGSHTNTYLHGAVTSDGSGTFVGGSFSSTRDIKIIHTDWNGSALDEISNLKVRNFNYKLVPDYDKTLGLIVDEIPDSISEFLVSGENKDAINTYSLMTLSIKALQEAKIEMDILKQEVKKLKDKIEILESK